MLKEDREKLLLLQPLQPWFTQEQREELAEVHPWIQQRGIPQEIDTQVCSALPAISYLHFEVKRIGSFFSERGSWN